MFGGDQGLSWTQFIEGVGGTGHSHVINYIGLELTIGVILVWEASVVVSVKIVIVWVSEESKEEQEAISLKRRVMISLFPACNLPQVSVSL